MTRDEILTGRMRRNLGPALPVNTCAECDYSVLRTRDGYRDMRALHCLEYVSVEPDRVYGDRVLLHECQWLRDGWDGPQLGAHCPRFAPRRSWWRRLLGGAK